MKEYSMRLLLLTGGRHPYHESTPILARAMRAGGHTVKVSNSAQELLSPGLRGYDAIVLNTRRRPETNNDLSPAQREAFRSYVHSGGGLVSIHISPDSCPDWPEMKKITGGGWVSGISNHPPYGRMTVYIRNDRHPVTKGIRDFQTDDELYCDLDIQPGIDVFLGAPHAGKERPLGWTLTYGRGRVCNIALGHNGLSHQNRSFQRLVLNGLAWVKG
jgi:type 1 glutamine amidotransferase